MHKQMSDPAFHATKPSFWYHPLAAEGTSSLTEGLIITSWMLIFHVSSQSFWFQPDYSHFLEDELDD